MNDPDLLDANQRRKFALLRINSMLPVPKGQCPCCWRLDHHQREQHVAAFNGYTRRDCGECGHSSLNMPEGFDPDDPDAEAEYATAMRELFGPFSDAGAVWRG